ncbi:MAG: cytochrome-c oxidase, partial [Xanthomonadales bacterium]|nr:cytochrome-c oxidase [Xanthomonadales bacterium]
TMWRSLQGGDANRIRISVELCSVYWHYLLLVWLALFALMLST